MPVISEDKWTITRAKFDKEELIQLFTKNIEAFKESGALGDEYKYTVRVFDGTGSKVCDDINDITVVRVKERSL